MEQLQLFWQQLTRMQWSDYLDILVVAFLIYRALPLIRTNGVMRIVRVVVTLLAITWLTEVLHLYYLLVKVTALFVVPVYNFVTRKIFLEKKEP